MYPVEQINYTDDVVLALPVTSYVISGAEDVFDP